MMDMCRNQTLNEVFKRKTKLQEQEVRGYLLQLVEGLKYMHDQHIIHRDLKLRNLFLTEDMQVKIGDFGLAARVEGTKRRTICGTPNYMSPEILNVKEGHSYETDIWSVGIIMYVLIIGRPPFQAPSPKLIYSRIKTGIYVFPKDSQISSTAKDLIGKLLNGNPTKRLTLTQILEHDFIAKCNVIRSVPSITHYTSSLPQRTVTPLIRQSTFEHKEKVVDEATDDTYKPLPLAIVRNVEQSHPILYSLVYQIKLKLSLEHLKFGSRNGLITQVSMG
jgi:serine/threonine protein kinase